PGHGTPAQPADRARQAGGLHGVSEPEPLHLRGAGHEAAPLFAAHALPARAPARGAAALGGVAGPESPRLQLLERAGPIFLEEPRQRTVGEQPPARLTGRAVVHLVLRVADPLHPRAAHGTGLPVPPVHRHALAERRHLLGEPLARLPP